MLFVDIFFLDSPSHSIEVFRKKWLSSDPLFLLLSSTCLCFNLHLPAAANGGSQNEVTEVLH